LILPTKSLYQLQWLYIVVEVTITSVAVEGNTIEGIIK